MLPSWQSASKKLPPGLLQKRILQNARAEGIFTQKGAFVTTAKPFYEFFKRRQSQSEDNLPFRTLTRQPLGPTAANHRSKKATGP